MHGSSRLGGDAKTSMRIQSTSTRSQFDSSCSAALKWFDLFMTVSYTMYACDGKLFEWKMCCEVKITTIYIECDIDDDGEKFSLLRTRSSFFFGSSCQSFLSFVWIIYLVLYHCRFVIEPNWSYKNAVPKPVAERMRKGHSLAQVIVSVFWIACNHSQLNLWINSNFAFCWRVFFAC